MGTNQKANHLTKPGDENTGDPLRRHQAPMCVFKELARQLAFIRFPGRAPDVSLCFVSMRNFQTVFFLTVAGVYPLQIVSRIKPFPVKGFYYKHFFIYNLSTQGLFPVEVWGLTRWQASGTTHHQTTAQGPGVTDFFLPPKCLTGFGHLGGGNCEKWPNALGNICEVENLSQGHAAHSIGRPQRPKGATIQATGRWCWRGFCICLIGLPPPICLW